MFRRTISRIIRWAQNYDLHQEKEATVARPRRFRLDNTEAGINFSLHRANGGYIVQTSFYDDKADCHTHGLYIINDGEDLGTNIAHIVTTENLRR